MRRQLRLVGREREILEHAVHTIGEQAAKADEIVDEAKAAGGSDHPVTVHAKMLRLELLKVKADLERELEGPLPQLHEVRSRRALGQWTRRVTGALGASRARAARRASGLSRVADRERRTGRDSGVCCLFAEQTIGERTRTQATAMLVRVRIVSTQELGSTLNPPWCCAEY
jgi:hypothetical protein